MGLKIDLISVNFSCVFFFVVLFCFVLYKLKSFLFEKIILCLEFLGNGLMNFNKIFKIHEILSFDVTLAGFIFN